MAGKVRTWIGEIKCMNYQLLEVKDNAPAVSEIILSVTVSTKEEIIKQIKINSQLIYQIDRISPKPLIRGKQGGEWYIIDRIICDICNHVDIW